MKKTIKSMLVILLVFSTLLFTACSDDNVDKRNFIDDVNEKIESCIGTCLTKEEMDQLVNKYRDIQKKESGAKVNDNYSIPELKLITLGEHKQEDNTRYEITTLEEDDEGCITGIKASVMEDNSECNIEEPEPEPVELLKLEAFMGDFVNQDNERLVLVQNGETVIRKEPDLSWYGGDISCIEYSVVEITDSNVLKLKGITTWTSSEDTLYAAPGEEDRNLSLDASSSSAEYTATAIENGMVIEMTDGINNFRRP